MPTFLRRPTPMELAELVAGATIRRRFRGKESIQRRLTGKQLPPGSSVPQSSNPATEAVPEVEEHPVVPEKTEPRRPLTEAEKIAWDALSPGEREVCDALVHRLHREHGHSDIRGMVDSLRQKSCASHSAGGRQTHAVHGLPGERQIVISPCVQWEDHGAWSGPTDGHFLLEAPHEGGACQRDAFGGCLFESGRGPDLANCTASRASWKCIGVGSEADATRVVFQVLRTPRKSHDRP